MRTQVDTNQCNKCHEYIRKDCFHLHRSRCTGKVARNNISQSANFQNSDLNHNLQLNQGLQLNNSIPSINLPLPPRNVKATTERSYQNHEKNKNKLEKSGTDHSVSRESKKTSLNLRTRKSNKTPLNNSRHGKEESKEEKPITDQQNNENSDLMQCPKCSLAVSGTNLAEHWKNCPYRVCSFCEEYYPKEIFNQHKKQCLKNPSKGKLSNSSDDHSQQSITPSFNRITAGQAIRNNSRSLQNQNSQRQFYDSSRHQRNIINAEPQRLLITNNQYQNNDINNRRCLNRYQGNSWQNNNNNQRNLTNIRHEERRSISNSSQSSSSNLTSLSSGNSSFSVENNQETSLRQIDNVFGRSTNENLPASRPGNQPHLHRILLNSRENLFDFDDETEPLAFLMEGMPMIPLDFIIESEAFLEEITNHRNFIIANRSPIFRNIRLYSLLLGQLNNPDKGLTKDQITTFQEITFGKINEDHDSCSICISEYEENEKLRVLPCKHSFHSQCIDTWLVQNSHCPLCKRNLSE